MSRVIIDCEDESEDINHIVTKGKCVIKYFQFSSDYEDKIYHTIQNITVVPSEHIDWLTKQNNESPNNTNL